MAKQLLLLPGYMQLWPKQPFLLRKPVNSGFCLDTGCMGRVTKRNHMQDGVVSWPQAHSRQESVGFAKRLSGMEN